MASRQHREANRRIPAVRTAGALLAGVATATAISTTKSTHFGTILVSGKTVYTLKASKTPCTAACLAVWPEVVLPKGVKKPQVKGGVNRAKLGTIRRSGGVLQVTYAGKPLYYFAGDSAAGQVNGNITDTWGKWSVVTTSGKAAPSSSGSGGSNAGTGGVSF